MGGRLRFGAITTCADTSLCIRQEDFSSSQTAILSRPRPALMIHGNHHDRAPSTFRQQDVTRAVRAMTAAGVHVVRIEIDKSVKIVIITADPTDQPGETRRRTNG